MVLGNRRQLILVDACLSILLSVDLPIHLCSIGNPADPIGSKQHRVCDNCYKLSTDLQPQSGVELPASQGEEVHTEPSSTMTSRGSWAQRPSIVSSVLDAGITSITAGITAPLMWLGGVPISCILRFHTTWLQRCHATIHYHTPLSPGIHPQSMCEC